MRKIVAATALALALTPMPASGAVDGCGIGGKIWQGRSGVIPWLAASFTNFTTFGAISTTFEIVGCGPDNNLIKKLFAYTDANMDHLAVEMARGGGEHLDAFAVLLEIEDRDREHFARFVQRNLPELVAHDDVTAGELLFSLTRLMAADETLSRYLHG